MGDAGPKGTEVMTTSLQAGADAHRPLILFVDGVDVSGPDLDGEALLCAWAITWEGRRELIAIEPGSKDAPYACWAFLTAVKRRCADDPLLVVTDGMSALLRSSELRFPSALHQRCLSHHFRQLTQRLPASDGAAALQAARACYDAPSLTLARAMQHDVIRRHAAASPSLVAYFARTFDSCTARLSLPRGLHAEARATGAAECLRAAERRREESGGTRSLFESVQELLSAGMTIRFSDRELRELEGLAVELQGGARVAV